MSRGNSCTAPAAACAVISGRSGTSRRKVGVLVEDSFCWLAGWLALLISLRLFAAMLWAMKGLAPTQLALAGAAADLLAGAIGALV